MTVPPDHAAHPFDPGLQPERTALAWRRTALTIVMSGVTALRYFPSTLGPWAAIVAVAIVTLGAAVLGAADRRYRAAHCDLITADALVPDPRLPALVTAATCAAGAACLAFVLTETITIR